MFLPFVAFGVVRSKAFRILYGCCLLSLMGNVRGECQAAWWKWSEFRCVSVCIPPTI
jgi:hypothetical protein